LDRRRARARRGGRGGARGDDRRKPPDRSPPLGWVRRAPPATFRSVGRVGKGRRDVACGGHVSLVSPPALASNRRGSALDEVFMFAVRTLTLSALTFALAFAVGACSSDDDGGSSGSSGTPGSSGGNTSSSSGSSSSSETCETMRIC